IGNIYFLLKVTARINSPYANPSGTDPDLQIFFAGYTAHCASSGSVGDPEDPEDPDAKKEFTFSPVVLHPKSKGYVALHSNNPFDPPKMVANYLTEPEDVRVLIAGIRVIQQIANSTIMVQKYGMQIDETEYGDCAVKNRYDSDEFWDCAVKYYTGPENHQACSCRMGPKSDPMAVVDNKLLVHGMTNLRIMDASAMPLLVSGNTHATIVMMAERGVDFIKEKWLNGGGIANRFGGESQASNQRVPAVTSPPVRQNNFYNHNKQMGLPSNFNHNEMFHKQHPNLPNPYLGYNGKYVPMYNYYQGYNSK
ncbi:glucose dehydrogenase [FAD, quinone]-like, partial [Sitophilus oryzae]|uniref:Glucose dehydrogenase [FAD, quinone]-like n=1 Tax=Sitophilus oryzae TaxID=7048 RepID=A0A6J2X647_SITOR